MRKFLTPAFVFTLTIAFGAASTLGHAAEAQHAHQASPAKLQFDHGRKWPTDEPLRQRMGEMRATLAAQLDAIHRNRLTPAEYKALGAKVEHLVGRIVAECKLEPKADAMLHLIIADLVAGADTMQGKSAAKPAAGAHQAVQATNAYGRYFQHPGWQPLH